MSDQRPTTRQLSLMHLAQTAERLAAEADALIADLDQATLPRYVPGLALFQARTKVSYAAPLLAQVTDLLMTAARDDA